MPDAGAFPRRVWAAAGFTNTAETGWHSFCPVWVN